MTGRGQQGQLIPNPDGTTTARYRTAGRNGKRPQRTFQTRRDAADWLREQLDGLNNPAPVGEPDLTISELHERCLGVHDVDAATLKTLRTRLRQASNAFGDRPAGDVQPFEWQTWRKGLKPGWARDCTIAAKWAYSLGVDYGWLAENPMAKVRNPRRRGPEVVPPTWDVVWAIVDEIDERYTAAPVVMAGAGLRPEELVGLHRADRNHRILSIRRVYSSGELKEPKKSDRQLRDVPLRRVVIDALDNQPTRIDTPILFAAPEGGYLSPENFRARIWKPAVTAAGVPYFPPKNLRHLYASEMLAPPVAVGLFTLSRRMGTGLQRIDDNYGHLVPDQDDVELARLDAHDAARDQRAAER